MTPAITAQGLTRNFGAFRAVDGLDLEIPSGVVSAFLGPNGAGKSTTIRMLLGLLRPSAGACAVLGHPPGSPRSLAQIGALVEMPSLYDHLTGRENARITQVLRGLPASECDRVLGVVGLARDAHRPVRTYSLGMRQRLGLALALMGSPRLLILDEPTNGMDPAGIQEIRELVRRLPQETGATVFLSSHILAEVEQTAQHLVVLHRGRLRYQGALEGFGTHGAEGLRVRVGATEAAKACLATLDFPIQTLGDGLLRLEVPATEAPRIAAALIQAGVDLYELAPVRANLEARFLAVLEEA